MISVRLITAQLKNITIFIGKGRESLLQFCSVKVKHGEKRKTSIITTTIANYKYLQIVIDYQSDLRIRRELQL